MYSSDIYAISFFLPVAFILHGEVKVSGTVEFYIMLYYYKFSKHRSVLLKDSRLMEILLYLIIFLNHDSHITI